MSLCTISYRYFIGAFRLMVKEIERKWIYNYDSGDQQMLPCVTILVAPPEFYGYSLFSRLKEKAKKSLHILKEKPADIINMKDFLDKRKS